ncbi:polyprenyl synthetase family protein [Propionibacterium australiense]|nr:polyprenyl synthetase family protein [Propionibacterium australiense]SYZ32660.1 Isoprenoid Synthase Type I [Propionibacterium australiense]VEH91589.1 Octaprenyl-diphosphate synthase [Propionibacterium australiense]
MFNPASPAGRPFRDAVGEQLSGFLDGACARLSQISPSLAPLGELARAFTAGGKRLRPAFCYWGHAAVAGQPADPAPLVAAAASFDLLHVAILMHDDVIDDSDTRRGLAAVHRQFEALHAGRTGPDDPVALGQAGDPVAFGRAGAILLGDLLAAWSDELVWESGFSPAALAAAHHVLDGMRTEVNAGQFLDMAAEAGLSGGEDPVAVAERVVEFKTARYTVTRPLQYGAALAGADRPTLDALAGLGSPLGRAFQFRDDLLGVFGDEQLTGKPAGDDLREGKRTVLIAEAQAVTPLILDFLGRPLDDSELSRARALLVDCGARARVEERIAADGARARAALDRLEITDEGRTALAGLIEACLVRDF